MTSNPPLEPAAVAGIREAEAMYRAGTLTADTALARMDQESINSIAISAKRIADYLQAYMVHNGIDLG